MESVIPGIKPESGKRMKPGMNLIAIVKDYIETMLSEMPGRKALILDKQTLCK